MSFFDKIGEAFNWVKDSAVPAIGGALAGAQHWVDSTPGLDQVDNALNPVHALVTNPIAAPVVGQGTAAVGSAFSYGIARPLSTFTQQVEDASQKGASASLLLDADRWRTAWNNSEDVSPGQALVIGSGFAPQGVGYDATPDAMQAREGFFHNTWQGQVSSGALDLALNLGADPTVLGAKAIKGAALARNTFKDASEVGNVLKVNAGEAASASRRESGLSTRMDKFFGQLDGKTSAEIMLHPVVKQSDQSGAFAYMFGRVNEEFTDEAARRAAQRNIFGAMLGNGDSITALKDQHALLANELQRLSDTPTVSKAVPDFTWDDHGQGMLAIANQSEPVEVTAQKDAIEAELARLETATSGTGTVNRLAGTLKEQSQYGRQLQGLRQSTLNTGLGNMPVRVIGGAIANRLPGHVSVKDPVSGFEDLRNTLAQSPYLTGPDRRGLLDNYVNAATDGDRQKAVRDAEGAIVHATGAQYGLTPQQVRKIAEAGNGRRQAVLSSLSSRLYSAADDDKFIHFTDPEEGEITAYSRPILQSQIEDNISIIDPRKLDAALKEATQNRTLERVTGQLGDDAKNVATSAYSVAGSAQMVASDVLGKLTRAWKDSALMRLAYPARIQIDSQMRLGVHMGALSYLGAAASGLKSEGKYILSAKGSDSLSLRNVFKQGDYEKSIGDLLQGAGVHQDDIPNIISKVASEDGGMADLAQHMTDAQLARYRATGEWGYVDQANPAWAQAWTRAVNRQIRNSPVAMKAAEGATADELKAFVQSNPAARKEWLNLKSSNGGDMDGWLANVQAHVDHYLPTAEMKEAVVGKPGRAAQEVTPSGLKLHRVDAEGTGLVDPAGKPQGLYFSVIRDEKTFENPHASWVKKASPGGRVEEHGGYALPDGDPRVLTVSSEDGDSGLNALKKLMPSDEFDRLSKVADKGPRVLAEDLSKKYPNVDWSKYERTGDMFTALGGVVARERGYAAIHAPANEMTFGLHDPFEEYVALTEEGLQKPTSIPARDGLPGRPATRSDIEKWFADQKDRMRVHGESFAPTTKSAAGEMYEKLRNNWYKMAAEAPETTMARTPLYAYAFKRNLTDIVARHGGEDALDATTMTNIRRSADRLARREVGKILYDTSHSSNLATTFRYVSPFFSAWEDMIKKWGGLFYDKPWAAARFEQAWQAPNNAGLVVDENGNRVDAEGNRFDPNTGRQLDPKKDKYLIGSRELVTVPARFLPRALQDALGTGELDAATDKKRKASVFSIDKNSFNIVFQGDPWWLPGAGPIVQVPVNEMVKNYFPEAATNPVIAAALPMGVSDSPVSDQFLPSWIRQAHNAFGNTQDHANVQAMLLAQETARFQNGDRGPIKAGEISDMTRNWFILRAITANASPVSMAPTPKAQFYIDQAHIYRQQYGQNWQEKFYKDFPKWYDLSLSLSNNDTGIVATLNAVDAAKKYRAVIADNPEYGWAAVGPDNQYGNTPGSAFNQAAYAWQEQPIGYGQQTQFRGKSSPQDALAKVESSKGWMQYQTVMTKLNLVLESRGLHSFQQKGAEDLAEIKKGTEDYLASSNPSWRQDFLQTDSGKVVNFLDWAQKAMSSNKDLANRPDMQSLAKYMQLRQGIQGILMQRSKHGLDANPDVKAVWDEANSYLRSGNIGFEQAFNRVLSHDDPSKELMGLSNG